MLLFFFFYLCGVFLLQTAYSQTAPQVRTGRPGQSIGPYAVGDKILQLQSGIQVDDNAIDTRSINNVVRYGIGEIFEVSMVFDINSNTANLSGLDNNQLGVRYNIFHDRPDWLKTLGVQFRTRFKGSGDFKRERQSYILTSAASFQAIANFSYGLNLSFQTNGNDTYIQKFSAINFSYALTDALGIFFEPYINNSRSSDTLSINTGASYTAYDFLAFDFSVGQDISDGDNKFISAGFSIRN